jgi:protein-tyrosine phosphatase
MIDIHYHLLFGLDDGPETLEASLAMAEASISEGVTHIVCTPHANDRYAYQPELNRERLAVLQDRIGDRVTLGLGCDFHLSYENIEDLNRNRRKYTINGKQFLLVEFPNFGISQNLTETLNQLVTSGTVPIITHPERNPTLVAYPDRLAEWLRCGCLVQITAGSLTGHFGRSAERMSHSLLKKNWVHFIASDAHSMQSRPPAMAPAYERLKVRYGQATADRMCIHNPSAAFFGSKMPSQPEPLGLVDEPNPGVGDFFRRVFRR